jgi:hypothetical protein
MGATLSNIREDHMKYCRSKLSNHFDEESRKSPVFCSPDRMRIGQPSYNTIYSPQAPGSFNKSSLEKNIREQISSFEELPNHFAHTGMSSPYASIKKLAKKKKNYNRRSRSKIENPTAFSTNPVWDARNPQGSLTRLL